MLNISFADFQRPILSGNKFSVRSETLRNAISRQVKNYTDPDNGVFREKTEAERVRALIVEIEETYNISIRENDKFLKDKTCTSIITGSSDFRVPDRGSVNPSPLGDRMH